MIVLGSWWWCLVSDITFGVAGDKVRHGFIYDTRQLCFGSLAGELVPEARKGRDGTLSWDFPFVRPPYYTGLEAI